MGLVLVTREKNGANDTPDGRRIAAALARAVDRERFTVFIELIGDSELGFQLVFRFLEGGGVKEHHITVEAKFTANKTGQSGNNPIIAGCGVIIEVDEGLSGGVANFILHFLKKCRDESIVAGSTSVLSWV